ncbi:MAG: DUF4249 domain-containing protein, partial [Bacteroidota bacterium]
NFSKSSVFRTCSRFATLLVLGGLLGCIEPTRPTFQIEDGFYLVEGRILAGEAAGEIRIRASNFREVNLEFEAIANASVIAVEAGGTTVSWMQGFEEGRYIPPPSTIVNPGETWHFEITLPDGTQVSSAPETIPEPITVNDLTIQFEQNSFFDDGLRRFVPRFELYLDFEDPADQKNFYAYDYRYWEEIVICARCENGRWRNGECVPNQSGNFIRRFDYLCDTDECFTIKEGNETLFGTDDFFNGNSINGFPLGGIVFEAYGGMLVEGIVYSITQEAFEYGEVIQDLVDGNTGLNPTIPAALVGNVKNEDTEGREVLGFISAASAASAKAFIDRTTETGSPLPFDNNIRLEPVPQPGVPPRAPCDIPGFRSSVRPVGWP